MEKDRRLRVDMSTIQAPPPPPPGPPPLSARNIIRVDSPRTPTTSSLKSTLLSRNPNTGRTSSSFHSPRDQRMSPTSSPLRSHARYKPSQQVEGDEDDDDNWDIGSASEDQSSVPPPPPPSTRRPSDQPTVIDKAMELAVSRLAKVIHSRGSDAILDDSVDTRELLADISAQVSRLLRSDEKREEQLPSTLEADTFDEESPQATESIEKPRSASLDSREKLTPYDLWSKRSNAASSTFASPATATPSHHPSSASKAVKLTTDQWDGLVQRLYSSLRQSDIHVAQTQRAIIAKELADVTFTPRINERSRKLASNDVSIMERSASLEAQRIARLNLERQRLAEKEISYATFKPKINEASRAMSSSSRLYENPFERREALVRKASMEREAAEKSEYTFSPVLNQKSRELAIKGKALQLASSPAKSEASHRRNSKESFKPSINANSRRLAASSSDHTRPVFERLYEEGTEIARRARQKETTPQKDHTKRPGPAVVVFRPGMEFLLETLERDVR